MKLPLTHHVDSRRVRFPVYYICELKWYSNECVWYRAMSSNSMDERVKENILLKNGDSEVKY